MNITKKSLATATIAATAVAGLTFAVAPNADAAATATKTFSKSFNDTCAVNPFGTYSLPSVVSGTVPTTVVHGAAFKLTNSKIKVTVPASLNQQAYLAGAKYQRVTFQVVNLNNKGITPSTIDAVKTDITTAYVAVPNNKTSTFIAPTGAGLTVSLKAGAKGTGSLAAGSVSATFELYDANKSPIFNGTVSCNAPSPAVVLTTIPIS